MANGLKGYFSTIRERNELLEEIQKRELLRHMYEQMGSEMKKEFLDFCTGMRGAKILRDSFFKEVMNPEYAPERLEALLSVLLGRKVRILHVLPKQPAALQYLFF